MSGIAISHEPRSDEWVLPSRGTVGMICLIIAESAIFIIFVVAYVFYLGKSLTGPTPHEVLELPIVSSGAAFQAVASLIFVYNLVWSYFKGAVAGPDPWDAWTLE